MWLQFDVVLLVSFSVYPYISRCGSCKPYSVASLMWPRLGVAVNWCHSLGQCLNVALCVLVWLWFAGAGCCSGAWCGCPSLSGCGVGVARFCSALVGVASAWRGPDGVAVAAVVGLYL